MGRTCVYSILVGLSIAVHSSMAFTSNIHEKMTRAERFAVFGSEDSVPEYEVSSVSLPRARHRRNADKNISLKLEIDGRNITFDFKPIPPYLATKYTPVWSAQSDEHAYENIRYDPLPTAMSLIGQFKMYHDVENKAAITVWEGIGEESIIEGVVLPNYSIKSLPKRLIGEFLKDEEQDYYVERSLQYKRSVISDIEEDKGYFVVFKNPNASKDVQSRILVDPDNLRREKRARDTKRKRKVPKAVYPKILIVLDHNSMKYTSLTQVLRFTLTFWNGVDMIYRKLDEPKVHLNIAGIIIAADTLTTPYIAKDVMLQSKVDAKNVISEMGKYFYKERVRFPMNRYDIIIAMTGIELYAENHGFDDLVNGYTAPNARACSSTSEASKTKIIENTGIVRYQWQYNGVNTATKITAYLFGVKNEDSETIHSPCGFKNGFIISDPAGLDNPKMQWSNCSRSDFSRYFSSNKSVCLRNKPLWIQQDGKVLPGRWLTVDGQCQNEGYAKACKLKKLSPCAAKGCQAKGSRKCVRTKLPPLPGSACGTNKAKGYYTMGYGTEMDGCGRFMKYSLFFSNFIIFIGGIAVAGCAIWALVDKVPFIGELVGNDLLAGAVYVLLVGGIIVAFIAFFGCIGASREVKCMLLTYFIIVFLLFVTMLIGGVLGYVFRAKVHGTVEQEMKNSIHVYDKKSIKDAWDTTQKTLHCCGVRGWRDWSYEGLKVPKSCCREISPGQYFNCNAGSDTVTESNTWKDGCLNSTQIYMQKHAAIMGGAGIAVACLMFFGMIFSCALFKMIE